MVMIIISILKYSSVDIVTCNEILDLWLDFALYLSCRSKHGNQFLDFKEEERASEDSFGYHSRLPELLS